MTIGMRAIVDRLPQGWSFFADEIIRVAEMQDDLTPEAMREQADRLRRASEECSNPHMCQTLLLTAMTLDMDARHLAGEALLNSIDL